MPLKSNISFEDTSTAFEAKNDRALRKAHLLFSIINRPFLSKVAVKAVKWALTLRLPVTALIKHTVFEQFCGGETVAECDRTISALAKYRIKTILDYSVEGESTGQSFDSVKSELLRNIALAKDSDSIPFCVFKLSALAPARWLNKLREGEKTDTEGEVALERMESAVDAICEKAHACGVPILIDAEESWLQDIVDSMAYAMMKKYNRKKCIVFNTVQMYRKGALKAIRNAFHYAAMGNYYLGLKLVRGAYMEKERQRAKSRGYESPILPSKEATDDNFNKGLAFCIDNKQRISLVCGSHNEYSNYYLALLMEKHGMKNDDSRVYFAQLYGMSDTISYNLAGAGYNVAKYVPYGPVKSVIPYLLRRADENTSVTGQSNMELALIKRELKRRSALAR